jgi:hypothetical protein
MPCSDALLLTLLGARNVAVYDGSMTEWAADPGLPLEGGQGLFGKPAEIMSLSSRDSPPSAKACLLDRQIESPKGGRVAVDRNRLESWKEIADYLRTSVRTVQRWEKSEGLPAR